MHFQILVDDQSGKAMLDTLVPKIIGDRHTFDVKAYKGIGRIPQKLTKPADASKRILLDNLPRLLAGYGKSWPVGYGAVVVVCDLDDKCLKSFRAELQAILSVCRPAPVVRFCIAIEEGEAWFLGDIQAIKSAYPGAKSVLLDGYVPDSICGTWERLADAISKGGSKRLAEQGWQTVGAEKSAWARHITPNMDVANNRSPSFNYFRNKLIALAENAE